MDIETINRLAEIMTQHDLTELSLEQDQVKVRLARHSTPRVAAARQALALAKRRLTSLLLRRLRSVRRWRRP